MATATDCEVREGTLYPVEVLKTKLGISNWAWRSMKRRGLRTVKEGNRVFVLGSDVIRFFERTSEGNDLDGSA